MPYRSELCRSRSIVRALRSSSNFRLACYQDSDDSKALAKPLYLRAENESTTPQTFLDVEISEIVEMWKFPPPPAKMIYSSIGA